MQRSGREILPGGLELVRELGGFAVARLALRLVERLPVLVNQQHVLHEPPAMAPMIKSGSAPVRTASGSGASGESFERSCSQA